MIFKSSFNLVFVNTGWNIREMKCAAWWVNILQTNIYYINIKTNITLRADNTIYKQMSIFLSTIHKQHVHRK